MNWEPFLPLKILKIFIDIPQHVSYNFHVLSLSKFGSLDAQKYIYIYIKLGAFLPKKNQVLRPSVQFRLSALMTFKNYKIL